MSYERNGGWIQSGLFTVHFLLVNEILYLASEFRSKNFDFEVFQMYTDLCFYGFFIIVFVFAHLFVCKPLLSLALGGFCITVAIYIITFPGGR
jgi:hypothetical protein